MKKNVRMGRDLGIISIPDASLIDIDDIDKYPPGQVCIVSTGSQGEPMSALALLARGESKWVKVGEHDTVILSSHAIPGNDGTAEAKLAQLSDQVAPIAWASRDHDEFRLEIEGVVDLFLKIYLAAIGALHCDNF
jgi:ribonuclease J